MPFAQSLIVSERTVGSKTQKKPRELLIVKLIVLSYPTESKLTKKNTLKK